MARIDTLTHFLTDVADAIREKKGTVGVISAAEYDTEIASISGGGETPNVEIGYLFDNNTSASASGIIYLLVHNATYNGTYDLRWANSDGIMTNYNAINPTTLTASVGLAGYVKMMGYKAIPKYATKIVAIPTNSNTAIAEYTIPTAKLWSSSYGEHLYSVGLLSDVHYQYESGSSDWSAAFTYLDERESVDAICMAGDLTTTGTKAQLDEWKTARDTLATQTPVYTCNGNHESYTSSAYMVTNPTDMRKYLDSDWVAETENRFYKIINDDVYAFVPTFEGVQASAKQTMFSADALSWLENLLETYRNQRVFLFAHVPPQYLYCPIGFGTGYGAYSLDLWGSKLGASNQPFADRGSFLDLLAHYKNVIWFSGHSHIKYKYDSVWDNLNVCRYNGDGARFVHISSLTVPRDLLNGTTSDYLYAESEGAVLDVYPNIVRVRCRNFVDEHFLGFNEYIIDTTPVTIPPSGKTLESISATKTKTTYYVNETLATNDIVVTASYDDGTYATVTTDATIDTSAVIMSTAGNYNISISYGGKSTTIAITVETRPIVKTLTSITSVKTTTAYEVDDTLSTDDITTTAHYSDDTTATVVGTYDTSGVVMSTAGNYTIGVSYTEGGVTKTTTIAITVSAPQPVLNPTIVLDMSVSGQITSKGGMTDGNSVSVNDGHGTKKTASSGTKGYVIYDGTSIVGRPLYYRIVGEAVGLDEANKVGMAVIRSNGASTSGTFAKPDYGHDSTEWEKLLNEDGTDFVLDSTEHTIDVFARSSSTSTATFPHTVTARIQIGYV